VDHLRDVTRPTAAVEVLGSKVFDFLASINRQLLDGVVRAHKHGVVALVLGLVQARWESEASAKLALVGCLWGLVFVGSNVLMSFDTSSFHHSVSSPVRVSYFMMVLNLSSDAAPGGSRVTYSVSKGLIAATAGDCATDSAGSKRRSNSPMSLLTKDSLLVIGSAMMRFALET
jgi:hypothetical protein